MAATANEVVSMERAISSAPQSRSHLAPTITAFTTQLDHGARQYNEMVTAAAQLVSAANTGSMSSSPMSQQRYRDELVNATDRLIGLGAGVRRTRPPAQGLDVVRAGRS